MAVKKKLECKKQLNKVFIYMSGMYGSIKGIAGNAVGEVKLLSLDNEGDLGF